MNQQRKGDIDAFFNPKSIAPIGSLKGGILGGACLIENLRNFGFQGKIYPVNPSYDEILGLKVYPSVTEVPDAVDLAVISTPARTVPAIIKECVEKGVKAAVVASDGFAERGEEGAKLEQEIVDIARPAGMRIMGPDTIGTTNTRSGATTNLYQVNYHKIQKGSIALGGQTGLIGFQAFPFEDYRYGISKICDYGNRCDVDEIDLIAYLKDDPDTKVISLYVEELADGPLFLKVARETSAKKPILIYKAGKSKETEKAAALHHGSIVGEYTTYASIFKEAGIIPLTTFGEVFELPKIFAYQPLPKGNRVAILTVSGAGGVAAADTAIECGLSLAKLSPPTVERLSRIHPTLKSNPVDLGPSIVVTNPLFLFNEVVEALANDENIDCLMVYFYGAPDMPSEFYSELLSKFSATKPVATCVYSMGTLGVEQASRIIESLGFPVFSDIETSIRALAAMVKYRQWLDKTES